MKQSKSKYGAVKTNGYASKAEARRAAELKLLEKAGKIENLGEQVKFEIIPQQKAPDGKVLERATFYVADFVYTDPTTGQEVIEDCKGYRTPIYRLKKKLMLLGWGIRIKEVA